uniref:Uncharacterized protein n=1 Tax=Strongyloides papillosus TaxID=174720 RepID=A0A0N5BKJ3_STREA
MIICWFSRQFKNVNVNTRNHASQDLFCDTASLPEREDVLQPPLWGWMLGDRQEDILHSDRGKALGPYFI